LSDIMMYFAGTRALDGVDATFRLDEVHGLIGENGAGKSTLVNILGGSLKPTRGRLALEGATVVLESPRHALRLGIAHVSQEGSLVPALTGAENILLGEEPRRFGGILRRRALAETARALVDRWFPGLDLVLDRPVVDLPMADRKVIEIVRALRGKARLVILDEPTATLEAPEKKRLWDIVRSLPQQGVGVVLISHFLSEIQELSDRITVLRDGRRVATLNAKEVSSSLLANLMLRREDATDTGSPPIETVPIELGAPILSARDWRTPNTEVPSFELRAGEIVGLIGLTGAGHFDFARSLYTRDHVITGELRLHGIPASGTGVRAMQRAGMAFVPDQRMVNALAADGSLVENLTMVHPGFAARLGILRGFTERTEAHRVIAFMNIKASSLSQPIKTLSGGNKQKVSIGKWLYGADDRYTILIFVEPTEGVDIGAKAEIHAHMRRLASRGAAILIASSDLGEISEVCHRALPFVHGRARAAIEARDFSESLFISSISGDAA
ncbi:MAG: sugar ABC transporter ATP-binding protein, partial [Rhodospirillum sp.]|nr:sugar ABC transporter ATP-binding protein [Rhodospirillum sp.]